MSIHPIDLLEVHPNPEVAAFERRSLQCHWKYSKGDYPTFFGRILYHAIAHLSMVKVALKMGACVNFQCILKRTPVSEAARCCHEDVVLYLLEQGADPNILDESNRTALDNVFFTARKDGYYSKRDIVRMLLRHGAKRNRKEYTEQEEVESLYQSLSALTVLCIPLVLPQCSKQNWLPLDLVRALELFL
jgi:hypothetical protein